MVRVANAQERTWEVSLLLPSFNTYYQENAKDLANGQPIDLEGNSWDALQFNPRLIYRAREELNLPLFLSLDVNVPVVTITRLEVGHEQLISGTTAVTQQEQVAHNDLSARLLLGWEMLPFLQPYIALERSRFTSERTGQRNGNDSGGYTPDNNSDYTETIYSTQLGLGITGMIPLNENADVRLRYEASYEVPQAVFVSNSYYASSGVWGQGTGGYTLNGKVQLDIPLRVTEMLSEHDGYFTIGGLISKRHWNGWSGFGLVNGLPGTLMWPENYWVKAGGFIGIGMFF